MILGTGAIAHRHAEHFISIPGCRVVAACDVNAERAQAFATLHGIERAFADLGEALAWGEFDAVVNATPDQAHKATSLQVIAAGKATPSWIVSHEISLDQAADAYKNFDARSKGWTKVLIKPGMSNGKKEN